MKRLYILLPLALSAGAFADSGSISFRSGSFGISLNFGHNDRYCRDYTYVVPRRNYYYVPRREVIIERPRYYRYEHRDYDRDRDRDDRWRRDRDDRHDNGRRGHGRD